jgi:hypothetical protein
VTAAIIADKIMGTTAKSTLARVNFGYNFVKAAEIVVNKLNITTIH